MNVYNNFVGVMVRIKFFTYLLSALFSFLFIFAGTGYNIIKYCCNSCATEGIEFIAHHSCNEIHHDSSHSCCTSEHNHIDFGKLHLSDGIHKGEECSGESCEINRVHVDNFSLSEDTDVPEAQAVFTFLDAFVASSYSLTIGVDSNYSYFYPPDFSLPDGRDILSFKSVLVI